ncbi:GH92 family glycosyl hydrolase [Mucilaginibacter aquaedulcis]|uniref:GH92 family glycosyl hydrolase n=1 Tax=Mucilaginibacter aquaedulcis TaxID=1187081 RepID=UPI0025B4F38A|nr:GH92 family glycosyl hydrolase [Mucilaginibacter aquaedulcis]MDN3546980.1 GH92 family glycosyl hydrolase [Mucilaginibacter aquaedulcis]
MLISKKALKAVCLGLGLCVGQAVFAQQKQLADYVNPFVGASTNMHLAGNPAGLGKTFPGAAVPFGMVQVSPNTITGGDNGSGYSYEHKTIEGFALTQMSGVGWYGDLGNFLVMPTTGSLQTSAGKEGKHDGYRSYYDKKSEKASAGYYSVMLSDHQIRTELTAAPHSGIMRFTFPQGSDSRIQIDLARRVGGTSVNQYIKVVDDHTIQGWIKCTPAGGGWGNGDGQAFYTVYFYAQLNKPIKDYGVWSASIPENQSRKLEDIESDKYQDLIAHAAILPGTKEKLGKHLGFYTDFATKANEQVVLKAGISYNSIEGAKNNLESEIKDFDFDKVHQQARALWNNALAKIQVTGGTTEEKYNFYTALYHTMIDPRTFQDVDGKYPGGDLKSHTADHFTKRTIFSGWDVFRSQMPLQTLINPGLVNDLINSQVTLATENGRQYFDRWELLNAYSGCMIGNPSISVIADAYKKGIRGYDVDKAYQYSINTQNKFGNGDRGFSTGSNSISGTLEYAYFDWCIAQIAKATGKTDDAAKYAEKAYAYKNVFDQDKNWFRPKKDNGEWMAWPTEGRLQQNYGTVESNPYQQGWFVPQDVPGLATLLGGNDKAIADLTAFFEKAPANLLWNNYYNHANEPVHHVPFLFNRLGAPWLTQKWTRIICNRAYHNKVEGLVGNEDVGQMSAWYVLAASGVAQVCPGDMRYEITSPVFSKVKINLDPKYAKGKAFTVVAKNNSPANIYIQSATLNGRPYHQCHLDYAAISSGATLELVMGPKPNKAWGK